MALVDPNIALSFKQVEIPQQRNLLAETAQVMSLQQAQMQMNKIRQTDEAMERIRQAAMKYGGPDDLNEIAKAYLSAPDPQHQALGLSILQKQQEKANFQRMAGQLYPGLFSAAPAAAPTATAPAAAAPALTNALAPAPAAPVNAMAAPTGGKTADQLSREILIFGQYDTPQAKTMTEMLKGQLQEMTKTHSVGSRLVSGAGNVLYEAPTAPTTLARLQSELAALPPGDPRRAEYQALIKKETTHAPGTVVNMPPQEKSEQTERGKMLVGEYSDISKAAKLATKTLPSIEANLAALDKGFDTGFGKEAVAAGARILGALGIADAEKYATDTQTFQSNATQALLQKQLEQKGPQTESDARRIEQIGSQLGKTKDANKFILTMASEQLRRDVEQRNFYDSWWKNKKTYDGAEDAWFAGEGGKSLFDRPALKKYLAPGTAVQQIPTSRTPAPAAAPAGGRGGPIVSNW